jgi:aryl-alcohol dehydrogenase-like predicted oxidoreductase
VTISNATKLALGSAQFGMHYGSGNTTGQVGAEVVGAILRRAANAGVCVIDTAHAYGQAEAVLGRLLVGDRHFRIVSKTIPLRSGIITRTDIANVSNGFQITLDRLGRRNLHGLLVHHANDLLAPGGDRLWDWMRSVQHDGLVGRIGVSVYSPSELKAVLDAYRVEIVQLPYNIYDQRFAVCGLLDILKAGKIEVHSRSAFLQGVLLMVSERLPDQFKTIRPHQARLHKWLREQGMTPLTGAMAVCLNDPRTDFVVVGCDSLQQFDEIIAGATQACAWPDIEQFALFDEEIINPSRWPKP